MNAAISAITAPEAVTRQQTGVPATLIMGVVNVTPDSFSDGGAWFGEDDAVAHGLLLAGQGAAIVDVGGESTRPGAARPSEAEELRRVVPVVRRLAAAGLVVSADTMRASVARAALEAGAAIINDVSGGQADPQMAPLIASAGVPFVLMHWRGHSATMQSGELTRYDDVVSEVCAELLTRVEAMTAAGVDPGQIILDPGLGFSKTAGHNWQLLARLDEVAGLGYPVLLGASRKRFLGRIDRAADGTEAPPGDRDAATAATSLLAAQAGAWCVRVHDVLPTLAALRVEAATRAAAAPAPPAGSGR